VPPAAIVRRNLTTADGATDLRSASDSEPEHGSKRSLVTLTL